MATILLLTVYMPLYIVYTYELGKADFSGWSTVQYLTNTDPESVQSKPNYAKCDLFNINVQYSLTHRMEKNNMQLLK